MNGWDLVDPLPLIAAVVDAFRAVVPFQKLIGKVSPHLAPDLGVLLTVPVHKINLACFVSAAGQADSLAVFVQHIFFFGFRKPLTPFVHWAHGEKNMGVRVAAAGIVNVEVRAHSSGNKLRGTVRTDKFPGLESLGERWAAAGFPNGRYRVFGCSHGSCRPTRL